MKILDGGMGDELFKRMEVTDEKSWSSKALLCPEYQNLVVSLHLDFINAGAECITTCNFPVRICTRLL